MKKLEDEDLSWKISKYERFLGPDELKEFSIKVNEKEFNEKIFKNKIDRNFHDFSECDSFNSGLKTFIRLKEGMLKKIKDKFNKKMNDTFDKLFNEDSIADNNFKEILALAWNEILWFKQKNYATIMFLNQSIKKAEYNLKQQNEEESST